MTRPDFGGNSEGGGEKFRGGAVVQLMTPMESQGLEWAKVNNMTYACSVLMYQCINELTVYNSLNFALHYNATKFISKHIALKGYLTEMNGYHSFNFTEKLSYKVQTLRPKKICGFPVFQPYLAFGRQNPDPKLFYCIMLVSVSTQRKTFVEN